METLKSALTSSPVLVYPDFTLPFRLITDASATAIGGVLAQQRPDGERVVAYGSRALTAPERKKSTTERECLSVVHWTKYWRPYLLGRPFTIITDHQALKWLDNVKDTSSLLTRWSLRLQEFTYQIEYRPGKFHANADALSRLPPAPPAPPPASQSASYRPEEVVSEEEGEEGIDDTATAFRMLTALVDDVPHASDELLRGQRADPDLRDIIDCKLNGQLPLDAKRAQWVAATAERCTLRDDGVLLHNWWPQRVGSRANSRLQVCLGASQREEALKQYHEGPFGGHFNGRKVFERMREKYWWPRMFEHVMKYCRECITCQRRRASGSARHGLLKHIIATRPWEIVGMDLLKCTKTARGNKYILAAIDLFTKFGIAIALPDQKGETITRAFFEDIVCRFGAPLKLLTDGGSNLVAGPMKDLVAFLRTKKLTTTPYHPQTDGQAERWNSILLSMLAKTVSVRQDDWDLQLPPLVFAYNNTPQDSTREAPFFLVYGRDAYSPFDVEMKVEPQFTASDTSAYARELVERLEQAYKNVDANLQRARLKQKKQYDKDREPASFQPSDVVFLHVPHVARGRMKKLALPYKGPYRILELLNDLNVRLVHTANPADRRTAHVSRLKPCIGHEDLDPDLEEVEEVLDCREKADGTREYKVKLVGRTERASRWVPAEDLNAADLLADFERRRRDRPAVAPTTAPTPPPASAPAPSPEPAPPVRQQQQPPVPATPPPPSVVRHRRHDVTGG